MGLIIFAFIIILALVIIIANIAVVQQSRAYVIERLGAFHCVWGLFRYAVYLDMAIQLVADRMSIDEYDLEEYRKRAYNNVRRTRGRVSLDSTLHHTGISDEE